MFDQDQIHVYGSDDDKVWVGDLGAVAPTDLSDPTEHEHVGFLGEDGITLSPADSVEKYRVHQGAKVVRTKMTASDTTFTFIAVQDSRLTSGLQFKVLSEETTTGVTTRTLSSGRSVEARSFVIDLFDSGVHKRYVIPRGEIGERSEVQFSNSALTAYSFTVEIIGDWFEITDDPTLAVPVG